MINASQFVDLQINGYAGVDFNSDDLSVESLHACCQRLQADRVAGILATVITDRLPDMCSRLSRIVELRDQNVLIAETIWGVHIEGPFLNETPGFIGAHPVQEACLADWDKMQKLLDAANGLTRIVTLAPERDTNFDVTSKLADRGILVSAGHCDPTSEQLSAAIDAGLKMFTHLGNGCPMHLHRHDNIIQRTLALADKLWISFIADGVHVDFPALGNYLRLADDERTVIVSDAISAAGLGPGKYTLGPQSIVIGEDLVPRAPDESHFVGSACPLPHMAERLRDQVGLSAESIQRLTDGNPRRLLSEIRTDGHD